MNAVEAQQTYLVFLYQITVCPTAQTRLQEVAAANCKLLQTTLVDRHCFGKVVLRKQLKKKVGSKLKWQDTGFCFGH